MPLQLREIGFHVENHATQWHGFQHEIQFQEIVVAWIQLTQSSLFLLRLNFLTKHAEVTILVKSSLVAISNGRGMPEHTNNISSSAQDHNFNNHS